MKYKLNEERFFSDITDGVAILIEIDSGYYLGLNPLTTTVFENIISGADTQDLEAKLSSIKGFDEAVKVKLDAFEKDLVTRGIIVPDESNETADIKINFDEILNDDLNFVISEFRDLSEQLLADPIHQVKKEKGWSPNKESLKESLN